MSEVHFLYPERKLARLATLLRGKIDLSANRLMLDSWNDPDCDSSEHRGRVLDRGGVTEAELYGAGRQLCEKCPEWAYDASFDEFFDMSWKYAYFRNGNHQPTSENDIPKGYESAW